MGGGMRNMVEDLTDQPARALVGPRGPPCSDHEGALRAPCAPVSGWRLVLSGKASGPHGAVWGFWGFRGHAYPVVDSVQRPHQLPPKGTALTARQLHDRADLDRLLRLVGMLGDPGEDGGFWDTWRTDSHGYSFKKMKAGINACATASEGMAGTRAEDFANYLFMFFSPHTAEEEAALIKSVRIHLGAGHDEDQVAMQFLADLRETAWRVLRDNSAPKPATVIEQWSRAEL